MGAFLAPPTDECWGDLPSCGIGILITTIAIVVVHVAQRRDSVLLDVIIGRRCPTPQGNTRLRDEMLPFLRRARWWCHGHEGACREIRSSTPGEGNNPPAPRGVTLIPAVDCESQLRVLGTTTHGQKNDVDSVLPG